MIVYIFDILGLDRYVGFNNNNKNNNNNNNISKIANNKSEKIYK